MRTNIDIDESLMERAKQITGLKTKKAVVEEALRRIVDYVQQREAILVLKGSADSEGNLRGATTRFTFIGSGSSGRSDISVNHDEYLAEDFV